jgi:hypothetical protein
MGCGWPFGISGNGGPSGSSHSGTSGVLLLGPGNELDVPILSPLNPR